MRPLRFFRRRKEPRLLIGVDYLSEFLFEGASRSGAVILYKVAVLTGEAAKR